MISPSTLTGWGVGYALSPGELERGAIGPLHAADPGSQRAYCGTALSIMWNAEDAGGSEVDCPGCRRVLEQGQVL